MARYRIEVHGEWAGMVGAWRPAISGTLNQTGRDDVEASTFDTRDEAETRALKKCGSACRPIAWACTR